MSREGNVKYKYLHTKTIYVPEEGNIQLPTSLSFSKSREIRYDKDLEYVGSTDNGWAFISKLHDKYYKIEEGLQEHEGNIYMTEVELL